MTRHACGAMWHIAGKSSVGILCVSIPNILRIASCNFRSRKLRELLTRACRSCLRLCLLCYVPSTGMLLLAMCRSSATNAEA